MNTSGSAFFFDGMTSARRSVAVELGSQALQIRLSDGTLLAEWPYPDLAAFSSPEGVLRIGLANNLFPARLEIRDAELAASLNARSGALDRGGAADRRTRMRVVGWSVAAAVSLVLIAIYGVPALADRLAPLVPPAVEKRFGVAIDKQVRSILDTGRSGGSFECGGGEGAAGQAAFDKLVRKLETAGALPFPLRASVIRLPAANAFALPGGRVYVFEGLIDKARTPDELAGVVAHEMGHVAHRDNVRSVMQAAGLSFLFGMMLGDFGGGATIIAARTVLQNSYTRDVETAADAYGAELVSKIGGDPRALGVILVRIANFSIPGGKILLDHPESKDRAAAIDAMGLPPAKDPLLTPDEWNALKRICATKTQGQGRGK
jgi:Zn-dependent protease with chaperone function